MVTAISLQNNWAQLEDKNMSITPHIIFIKLYATSVVVNTAITFLL